VSFAQQHYAGSSSGAGQNTGNHGDECSMSMAGRAGKLGLCARSEDVQGLVESLSFPTRPGSQSTSGLGTGSYEENTGEDCNLDDYARDGFLAAPGLRRPSVVALSKAGRS